MSLTLVFSQAPDTVADVRTAAGGKYAYDYGVRGDGTTHSAAALQACLDDARSQGVGTVSLPSAPSKLSHEIMLESQPWVPDGIRLSAPGRRGAMLKAISGVFPQNTPILRVGNPNVVPPQPNDVAFDCRLENVSVHASSIPGSSCISMHGLQEGAGLEHVGLYGFKKQGVLVESSQNFRLSDLEIYGDAGSSNGVEISASGPCAVEWVTSNPANTSTGMGVYVHGCPQVVLRQIHVEQAKQGIYSNSGGTVVIGALGSASCETLVYFHPNNNSGVCMGLAGGGSPTVLQDDWSGYTHTANDLAFYAQRELYLGVGLTGPASRPAGFFQGTLKTYRSTTANRQSAATLGAGAQAFDATLGIPIWSDGANWRDAAGRIV